MHPNARPFLASVGKFLPAARIHDDEFFSTLLAIDASPFEAHPFAVLDVETTAELRSLLASAAQHGISLTFRGSGTSVCGQCVAEDALVRFTGSAWHGIDVLDGGGRVSAGCLARGGEINASLASCGTFITCDPASIAAASIGGMTANN
ncbi:MAG: FAD-binding oxidoreductase, partial [Mailhella sp.]|nr:FAD-binding oxidoreductase [Mailhella sp.]